MATARPGFICAACARSLRVFGREESVRWATTSSAAALKYKGRTSRNAETLATPRWKSTPERMKMPIRVRPASTQKPWRCNEDPEKLDGVLDIFFQGSESQLGKGRDVLPEEVKWLAVTHKTFEQGARGFNDRLALLGKRLIDVQVSKTLLAAPLGPNAPDPSQVVAGEAIIGPTSRHKDLIGVDNLSGFKKKRILDPQRVAGLAESYGIDKITRWVPRLTEELDKSGRDIVLANTLYALIGAVSMQHGGEAAVVVAQEKILRPLGL